MQRSRRQGFTLLEMMIVIGITAAIAAVATLSLVGRRSTGELTSATQQITALFREAQSDSMTQKQGEQWGVHLDNTTSADEFFSIFYTPNGTYASGTVAGRYSLPAQVCFATSSVLAGSSTDIIFNSLSGAPVAAASITLELVTSGGCAAATTSPVIGGIAPNGSGQIFFDDFNGRSNL